MPVEFVVSSGTLSPKGEFDKNHITGTETMRGADPGMAKWRGDIVADVVRRAEVDTVTTDSIRYILDGIRDYGPNDRIPAHDIDLFVEYTRSSAIEVEQKLKIRDDLKQPADEVPDSIFNVSNSSTRGSESLFVLPEFPVELVANRLDRINGRQPPHGYEEEPPSGIPELIYGKNPAVLFVSDLHLSDGGAGDDFMFPHLQLLNEMVVGSGLAGGSKAIYLVRVVAFVLNRLSEKLHIDDPKIDFVINGDIIDQLELLGRGSYFSNAKHGLFLALCRTLIDSGHRVIYTRGNHDFIPPSGPWEIVDSYANARLKTFAEHGDRYDAFNWPKGLNNTGSRIVTGGSPSRMGTSEVEGLLSYRNSWDKYMGNNSQYYHAGVDNLRPLDLTTFLEFFFRRKTLVMALSAGAPRGIDTLLTYLREEIGQLQGYNEKSALQGVKDRRMSSEFTDWLVVMGHTHEPVSIPAVYYNTGSWMPVHRLLPGDRESFASSDPFLLCYEDPDTKIRIEEFFTLNISNGVAAATLRDAESVNRLRQSLFGIDPIVTLPR